MIKDFSSMEIDSSKELLFHSSNVNLQLSPGNLIDFLQSGNQLLDFLLYIERIDSLTEEFLQGLSLDVILHILALHLLHSLILDMLHVLDHYFKGLLTSL